MAAPSTSEPQTATVVKAGRVLNVFTGELHEADVVVQKGRIAAVVTPGEADDADALIIDASDRVIVPGYVEPHAHLALLAEPVQTLAQMAAAGTTTVVADTYPFLALLSDDDCVDVLDRFQQLPIFVRWILAPHARSFVDDEAELFSLERLRKFLPRPDVVAIGELTRWPQVAAGDPDLLAKIAAARALGKRVEGHGAGASLKRLQALVRHGVTSDHEAITAEQVADRLRVGLYTMLRHSSLRPDLPQLIPAVRGPVSWSNRIMLTADGPTPGWMAEHGYMDYLVRVALQGGIAPAAAYRMATLNPAMYYGLDGEVGSIAPGRRADLLVLRDLADPTPELVMAAGRIIAREGRIVEPLGRVPWEKYAGLSPHRGKPPAPDVFRTETAELPTLHMANTVILRSGDGTEGPAVVAALYDWNGRQVVRARLTGFVDRLGGFASSYSPALHMLVLGQDAEDMAAAARRVMEKGGGMCLVEDGRIVWELQLERGGLFTETPWQQLVESLSRFEGLMHDRGYRHGELLYSMFFLGFDSLPDLRITSRGVWDVRGQKVVSPPERLDAAP